MVDPSASAEAAAAVWCGTIATTGPAVALPTAAAGMQGSNSTSSKQHKETHLQHPKLQ
jgi:hypothetical protein